jgi:predicted ATPase
LRTRCYCDAGRAAPLAQLVHEKSAGNPFFVIQFLSALIDEGLVTFDHPALAGAGICRVFTRRAIPTT